MNKDNIIQKIRRFNRVYTQQIGALNERYLDAEHSLTELRILHELYHNPGINARGLAQKLAMDGGFLSRTLSGLNRKGLIERTRDPRDKRQYQLTLTPKAMEAQPAIEASADAKVAAMLAPIPAEKHAQLVEAMARIEHILEQAAAQPVQFRQLQPGDAGWIIHRHGGAIAREFGWNMEFEALCAQIMADFIRNYRPEDERSWIVERGGEILGSLFLVRENETTARLRLLYVEPAARGMGLASKLLEKSIQFARSKQYQTLILFTTDSNVNARRIYTKLGMSLVKQEAFAFAGKDQTGETWSLDLATATAVAA